MAHSETALILGASKGLGREIADACRARGWGTIEVSRSLPKSADHGRSIIRCDLADERQALALTEQFNLAIVTHFFWSAGIWDGKRAFASASLRTLLELLDVNLRNPIVIAHEVWGAFTHAGAPRTFVAVSSMSGLVARAGEETYVSTKWGQVGLMRSLGREAAAQRAAGTADIRVRLFCPGGMRTELFGRTPPPNYRVFMDPTKVAHHLLDWIASSDAPFEEQVVERSSELGVSLR